MNNMQNQHQSALEESRIQFRDSILSLLEDGKWDEVIRLATAAKQQESIQEFLVNRGKKK